MQIIYKYKILVFLVMLASIGYSQKGNEVGGWIGTSYYFGDLNTTLRIQKPGLAGGINIRRNFDQRVAIKTSFNFGRVSANDASSDNNWERTRNLSFRSNLFDWSNVVEFNFFDYEHGHRTNNRTPYFFGGFNLTFYEPSAEIAGKRFLLRPLGTEGQKSGDEYNRATGGLILGGGIKWDINRLYSINIEASTRFLFTDFLDDVSGAFPDKAVLLATRGQDAVDLSDRSLVDGFGDSGRQRGDTKGNDKYTFVGIAFMKYFGGIECPKISRPDR